MVHIVILVAHRDTEHNGLAGPLCFTLGIRQSGTHCGQVSGVPCRANYFHCVAELLEKSIFGELEGTGMRRAASQEITSLP
jgi:hypothetical protein